MEETKLTLWNRENFTMEGVSDIAHLDDRCAELTTASGTLRVEGSELKLKTLSPQAGQVILEGRIDALLFEQADPGGSLWNRLWR